MAGYKTESKVDDDDDDDRLYSAILRSRADSLRSHVILHEWLAFYSGFFFKYPKWCTGMAGATWNCCHLGASSVYTIQPCTMPFHAKPHTYGVCVFTCNLPPVLLAEWPGSFTCYCGNGNTGLYCCLLFRQQKGWAITNVDKNMKLIHIPVPLCAASFLDTNLKQEWRSTIRSKRRKDSKERLFIRT